MSSLILLIQCKDSVRVSSLLISEQTGTSYKATNNLIRKHKDRIETLGQLPFQKAVDSKSGRAKPALLNEDQAIFLLTLSRNTQQVVEFKLALTKEFAKLRRTQACIDEMHAKAEWQQNRSLGKLTRGDITGTIKEYIAYAQAQGSRGAPHYFTNITTLVNTALSIDNRDSLTEDKLHILATAEYICKQCLLGGMAERLPYKSVYQGLNRKMKLFAGMLEDCDGG